MIVPTMSLIIPANTASLTLLFALLLPLPPLLVLVLVLVLVLWLWLSARQRTLRLNPKWSNPSGEWHVGLKRAYELFPKSLVTRVKAERRKEWDKKHLAAEVRYSTLC